MGGLWFAYSQIPFLMGMSGNRQDEARAFLQTRAACGANVACLKTAYHQRNATLKQQITSGHAAVLHTAIVNGRVRVAAHPGRRDACPSRGRAYSSSPQSTPDR